MQQELFKTENNQTPPRPGVPLDAIVSKPVLLNGDCLKLMFDLPDNSVDMVCCDMPYGTTACKWDTVLPLDMLWHHYDRIVKNNGAIVLFCAQPFTSALVMSRPNLFKYDWTWRKPKGTGHLNAKKQPMRDKEDVCVFYKKQPTYFPQFSEGNPYPEKSGKKQYDGYGTDKRRGNPNTGTRYPKQVLEFGVVERDTLHPTQKPVELIEYLIKTYTVEGDTVLDNCMGSGTTGVACKNLNREFIGIELDENYYQIATKRIEAC
jgi:DNA modification methylase